MENRTQTADLIKGVAVLLMIQVHIIELFATETVYNSPIGKVLLFLGGPAVAPAFMIVLGYFIALSKKTTHQLIIRGTKIIVLGMLLNLALNLNLIFSVYKGVLHVDVVPYVFGVDILQFAGISIIVLAIFKKVIEKSLVFVLVSILVSAFLGHFLLKFIPSNMYLKYISAFFYGSCWWSYFPFFPWFAYPLSGIVFYKITQLFDFNFLQKKILLIGCVCFVFLFFTIAYAISVSANLPLYYHHNIVFFLWVILFLAFYSYFISKINLFAGNFFLFKYLKWLGKNVTLIYVIQWILIGNTATEIYKTIDSPTYLLACFASVLIITSCVGYGMLWLKKWFNKTV